MTRINCIPVSELSDSELGAEYRELPRLYALVAAAAARCERPDDPKTPTEYVLGRGHVRFFYPRMAFVAKRHRELVVECASRGRKVTFLGMPPVAKEIPSEWWGWWTPDEKAMERNRRRLAERRGI